MKRCVVFLFRLLVVCLWRWSLCESWRCIIDKRQRVYSGSRVLSRRPEKSVSFETLPIENYRNIGIMAHIDAGKTTTTERILYYTGRSKKVGEVHDGDAIMDWMPQEKERGITITSAVTTCFWTTNDIPYRINIVDTPGHVDFTVEVERSLRVLDGAVAIIDAVAGVEPQTETVWFQADSYKIPRIVFVNKMDRQGADFMRSAGEIKSRFGVEPLILQLPVGCEHLLEGVVDLVGQKTFLFRAEKPTAPKIHDGYPSNMISECTEARKLLLEQLANSNDVILEKFLDNQVIDEVLINETIRSLCLSQKGVPILLGASLRNTGINLLLDAITLYLPSPYDRATDIVGAKPSSLGAYVFKLATDPHIGMLAYSRIYQGTLNVGDTVYNPRTLKKDRVQRVLLMHANDRQDKTSLHAGELGAVVGLNNVITGDTLCNGKDIIVYERIKFPQPVLSRAIEVVQRSDSEKLLHALEKLTREDPSLVYCRENDQTILKGMGELHLDIILNRLAREFKIQVNSGPPKVAYKETYLSPLKARGKYIRQSGGRGQYGDVEIQIEPLERGSGLVFDTKIYGGAIPKSYFPAIEAGIREHARAGGVELTDVRVTAIDGSFHAVDSSEYAFKIAATIALKQAALINTPSLLEPLMQVDVRAPTDKMGGVIASLRSKRGRLNETVEKGNFVLISAKVPLAGLFDFSTNLRSITQGRGAFTMSFSEFDLVPPYLRNTLLGLDNETHSK